jgi:hypothetical protein
MLDGVGAQLVSQVDLKFTGFSFIVDLPATLYRLRALEHLKNQIALLMFRALCGEAP